MIVDKITEELKPLLDLLPVKSIKAKKAIVAGIILEDVEIVLKDNNKVELKEG